MLEVLTPLLLSFVAFLPSPHGGVYRGPGAGVPPVGAPPPTGGGPSTSQGSGSSDLTGWQLWWGLNRDPFLRLKRAVHSGSSATGDDDFYLGAGEVQSRRLNYRPSRTKVDETVLPALLEVLEKDRQTDLISAALLALGKIGEGDLVRGEERVGVGLEAYLTDSNQEIAESAALALGILGSGAKAPLLAEILSDSSIARRRLRGKEIPRRTRAFAAYGLGLIGQHSAREDVRRFCVHALLARLAPDQHYTSDDVPLACAMALGLVRLEADGSPFDPEVPPARLSREGVLEQLLSIYRDNSRDKLLVAYLAVPIARLAKGLDPSWARQVEEALYKRAVARPKPDAAIEQTATQALGLLGDLDGDAHDVKLRATLLRIAQDGDRLAQRLALISLARVSSRPGSGETRDGARDEVFDFLLRRLARGSNQIRPWVGLALGLSERLRGEAGLDPATHVRRALRSSFKQSTSPGESGALALGMGLAGDEEAAPMLLASLEEHGDEELRSHLAVALGLLGERRAIGPLREVVRVSEFRPQLLRESSIGLALLGDKEVLDFLLERLAGSKLLSTQASLATAIGYVGDARALEPLADMIRDRERPSITRAFAAVALGLVADKQPLPWNSRLAVDAAYWRPPATLIGGGKGILDLL